MRMSVKGRTHTGRVVDLEEGHLVALHQPLYEHVAAIHRLALDRLHRHRRNLGIPGRDHICLRDRTSPVPQTAAPYFYDCTVIDRSVQMD